MISSYSHFLSGGACHTYPSESLTITLFLCGRTYCNCFSFWCWLLSLFSFFIRSYILFRCLYCACWSSLFPAFWANWREFKKKLVTLTQPRLVHDPDKIDREPVFTHLLLFHCTRYFLLFPHCLYYAWYFFIFVPMLVPLVTLSSSFTWILM